MKALRGNGKRALAVVAAALVAVGAASQAMSSPGAAPPSVAGRQGSAVASQISRRFRHEDALDELRERGESFPTPQGLRADGLRWQAIAKAEQSRQMDASHSTAQWLRAPGPPDLAILRAYQQSRHAALAMQGVSSSTTSVSRPPDVTDAAFTVQSGSGSSVSQSGGFAWGDWAIGLGSGMGLALLLGVGLVVARQYRHGVQPA
jgi:hypothetical protein